MPNEIQIEMLSLLSALCENRLSREGRERLEELVISSRSARKLYVRYMNLHGTLMWDAALSESASLVDYAVKSGSSPALAATSVSRPERWSVARVGSLAGLTAVVLFATIFQLSSKAALTDTPGLDNSSVVLSQTVTPPPQSMAVTPIPTQSQPLATTDARPIPHVSLHRTREVVPASAGVSPKKGPFDVINPAPVVDSQVSARIDELLQKAWTEAGVKPAPAADDAEWLRRVYLDLAGHIPDRESLDRFLADTRSNKRSLVVESLFRTPDYARNLTTVWLNLLVGRSNERPINRELLAKFLRHQFHDNRPWTETVSRLVAAEGDGNEVGEANFLLAHLNNQAVPATAVTARIFLCRQVQCTQCHKHPDSKHGGSMSDFWEFNSFFQQASIVENTKYNPETGRTDIVSRSLVDKSTGGPTFYDDLSGLMRVAYPKFAGEEVDPEATVKRRQELARLMTTVDQRELAAALVNRTWNHFFGQGLVNPIDDMGPHSPCANPELLRMLTDAVVATKFDLQKLNRWIVSSRAYQLSSVSGMVRNENQGADDDLPLFNQMSVKPLSAEQVFDSLLVATDADRVGASDWEQADNHRQTWMKQFFTVMENEENCDASRFDGTFSQTLMMMNGDLVQNAVRNQPGTVLHEILRTKSDDMERVRQLCRAALGRDPKRTELAAFQSAVKRRGEVKKGDPAPFEDMFWSYLNSTEFAVNH